MILKYWDEIGRHWTYEPDVHRLTMRPETLYLCAQGTDKAILVTRNGQPFDFHGVIPGDLADWSRRGQTGAGYPTIKVGASGADKGTDAFPLKVVKIWQEGRSLDFLFNPAFCEVYLLNDEGKTIERL